MRRFHLLAGLSAAMESKQGLRSATTECRKDAGTVLFSQVTAVPEVLHRCARDSLRNVAMEFWKAPKHAMMQIC